jgi:hypothetical protein
MTFIESTAIAACRGCGCALNGSPLEVGDAAINGLYPVTIQEQESAPRFRFRLEACSQCGLLQLHDTPQPLQLRPPGRWTLFRDPERHLDDLSTAMASHLTESQRVVMGLTYKDAPLVDRLRRLRDCRTVVLSRDSDWELSDPRDGIETMQGKLTPQWAERIRARYGPADVLCVRHLLEHAHHLPMFLAGCRALLAPEGWVLFETPGCETELIHGDAGALWEEHVMYFTPSTLRNVLERHGFHCRWIGNYPYPVEDCLAAWGRFDHGTDSRTIPTSSGADLLHRFDVARRQLRDRLEDLARTVAATGRKLALWGAGHRTTTLVELLPARELFECVIDDDPDKQGRFLPGSHLPIVSAEVLSSGEIGACLCLLNPAVLQQVRQRLPADVTRGTQFVTLPELCVSCRGRDVP